MAAYSDFLPYVLPYANGCSEPMAEQVVRDICIDFCNYSLILQQTHDPITAVAGMPEYEFSPPTGTAVREVLQAWYESTPIFVFNADTPGVPAETFNRIFTGANTTPGTPRALMVLSAGSFTLDTAPSATSPNAITLRVGLTPTRDSTEVDDLLLNDYAYEIGQGALGRLLLMPGQPFSNPQLAAVFTGHYLVGRNSARIRANKSLGRSQVRVMPRAWV